MGKFDPETLEYGVAVARTAATGLQSEINELATSADPQLGTEGKTDLRGAKSLVTKYDRAVEDEIQGFYRHTRVRVKGEEGEGSWDQSRTADIDLHVDPIDGTELFTQYFDRLVAWAKLPPEHRPSRPVCGAVVSMGAVRVGTNVPEWGVIAAPFLTPDGVVLWTAGASATATRTEPDGREHRLPPASTRTAPATGGVVLMASDSTLRRFGAVVEAAGYRAVQYKAAAIDSLCVVDPDLFERLRPGELNGEPVVGVVMNTAKNWDIAAAAAIANQLGYFVSDLHGRPRTFEDGILGAIMAVNDAIGQKLVAAVAPHMSA